MTQSSVMSEWSGSAGGPVFETPARPGRSHLIVAALLSVAFVAATVLLAVVAHRGSSTGVSTGLGAVGAPTGQRVQGLGGPTEQPTTCCPTPPSRPPLDPQAINRTFQVYMNALLHHDLRALHSATCPRLRHTEVGFELHGNYLRSWRGKPYTIEPDLAFVTVRALVKFTDPSTGGDAGRAIYSWYVRRAHGGHYYVCGFLS